MVYNERMSRVNIILLLIGIMLHQCVSQEGVQNYMRIRPVVVPLSENRDKREVKVTCKQTPASSKYQVRSLAILRKPLRASRGPVKEQTIVQKSTGGKDVWPDPKKYTVSGSITAITLTLPVATCDDARYTYICRMTLTNGKQTSIAATIKTEIVAPSILLLARPAKKEYSRSDTLTLTCQSRGAVGLTVDASTRGAWVWEYNDAGKWMPADRKDIVQPRSQESGCFQKIRQSSLKIRVKDFKKCARRFRCYISRAATLVADKAREYEVAMAFDCNDGGGILGADPVVAIIGVLAAIAVFVSLAFLVYKYSSNKRAMKKKKRQREIDMRILSPMSRAQRDKLLKEQMEQMAKKPRPQKRPEAPKPLITLDQDLGFNITPDSPDRKKKKGKKRPPPVAEESEQESSVSVSDAEQSSTVEDEQLSSNVDDDMSSAVGSEGDIEEKKSTKK